MCGIVGYIGTRSAQDVLLEGLAKLEYRGYDSAGVAIMDGTGASGGGIQVRKKAGKLANLSSELEVAPLSGTLGIGHTRWATHGLPNDTNAHPHATEDGRLVIIHNGIIENYLTLKAALVGRGHVFKSETDSEVLAHLSRRSTTCWTATSTRRCGRPSVRCAGPTASWSRTLTTARSWRPAPSARS